MAVDPQIQTVLDQIASIEGAATHEQTPAEARTTYDMLGALTPRPDDVSVDEIEVDGAAGALAARRYRPPGHDDAGPGPGLVFFHGGGYVIGSLDSHDGVCGHLATAAECTVIAVDYRLAPEHPLPAAVDDGLAAHRDVVARAGELGVDPARVAVGGESAGGHLTLNVALAARDGNQPRPAALLLVTPVADWGFDQPSMEENAEGYVLTKDTLLWFRQHSVPADADPASGLYSPLHQPLHDLPPAVVVTARYDPLRDQGDELAGRLAEAGVAVRHLRHADLVHTFVQLAGISERAREAAYEAGRALGDLLRR